MGTPAPSAPSGGSAAGARRGGPWEGGLPGGGDTAEGTHAKETSLIYGGQAGASGGRRENPPPRPSPGNGDIRGVVGAGGLRANPHLPEAEVPAVPPAIPLGCGKSRHLGSRGGHTVPLAVPPTGCASGTLPAAPQPAPALRC